MRPFLIAFFLLAALASQKVYGQTIPTQYIETALNNNLVLKEKKTSLDKSLLALKEARSLFLPTSWMEGQYTLANGGRTIDIPVGDLMNPVFQTLNELTGSSKFPQVTNVSEQFLPNNFYDVRLKTTVPLINPDIRLNTKIKQQQSALQQTDINVYKRELVKEVKSAYYNYLGAQAAVHIYEHSLEVVKENLRTNQSLLTNGKGLPAYVTRAESEWQQVEAALHAAQTNEQNAKAYFNFLLNRSLTEPILTPVQDSVELANMIAATAAQTISGREELQGIRTAQEINRLSMKMDRSFRAPRVNAFLDLASQGFDFNVNDKTIFYLGGVQVQVPIFTGKRNLYKIRQTGYDATVLSIREDQLRQQLELASFTSRNNIQTAYTNYLAAQKQEVAAKQYFRLIDKGYKEGVNSFIEFLDARDQLTRSQLRYNIDYYKVLVALAEYERQTASFSF